MACDRFNCMKSISTRMYMYIRWQSTRPSAFNVEKLNHIVIGIVGLWGGIVYDEVRYCTVQYPVGMFCRQEFASRACFQITNLVS